jgi:hypothetical protein
MILFLSELKEQNQNSKSFTFATDIKDVTVEGLQTNEAPVKYALKRLAKNGLQLDRIIALVTPKAEETAYSHFASSIKAFMEDEAMEWHEEFITPILIPNDVTVTLLLHKTIEHLQPIECDDCVVIDTTGGYRNAISALTLLSRFLSYRGIRIEFSTYSDFQTKEVTCTAEADDLFDMLDAVNLFVVSGNPTELKKCLKNTSIPTIKKFFMAMNTFYETIICCKISKLDDAVKELRSTIDEIAKAEIDANNPKLLVFRDLVREIVSSKMAFVNEKKYLPSLIEWCCDNNYIQQAITILWERALKGYWQNVIEIGKAGKEKLVINVLCNQRSTNEAKKEAMDALNKLCKKKTEYNIKGISYYQIAKIRHLRNNFSHADGRLIEDSLDNIKKNLKTNIIPLIKNPPPKTIEIESL